MSKSSNHSDDDKLWKLVNEFTRRLELGEKPTIEEYCQQYPEFAEEISNLFPTVVELDALHPENQQPDYDDSSMPGDIGDYQLLEVVGRGGMGVVYRAKHVALGREVALKVLPSRFAGNENALARFRNEGKTIAKLHHTNIVPLFEFGEEQGVAFLVMQLINGQSLDHVIAEKDNETGILANLNSTDSNVVSGSSKVGEYQSLPSSTALSSPRGKRFRTIAHIGLQAADALEYAHRRDVIHRDIKPSNLILDKSGVVWLTDFGLAKLDEDGSESGGMTKTGDMLGTLRYMAPERFSGDCDARADIYALGLTLYELLTGKPAFDSSSKPQMISAISQVEPPRPRSINKRIPRDLETIVLKASNKEPKSRYSSAREMAEDLRRFLRDEPIRARRVSWLEHTMRWAKRNRALATSLAMLALVLVGGLIGTSLAAIRFREQAETIEQDLYRTEMLLAGREFAQPGGISSVRTLMRNWIPSPGEVDRRGPEWHFYFGLSRDELQSFQHPKPVVAAQFSPNDQLVATGDLSGSLRLWDTPTGRLLQEINAHTATINDLAFSPQGDLVASVSNDNSAKVWSVPSGKAVCDLDGHTEQIMSVAFSTDGKFLATGAVDGLRIYNSKTFELIHQGKADKPVSVPISEMNWHPQKSLLLTISRDDTMLVWDPETGEIDQSYSWLNELPELEFWFANYQIKWDPNAERIMAIGSESALIDLPREGVERKGFLFEHRAGKPRCGDWSKDGKQFFLGGESLEVHFFDSETKEELTRIRGHEGIVTDVCLNSDGTKLLTASEDGTAKVWKYPELPARKKLWAEGGLALSPNGRHVALAGGTRGRVLMADVKSGKVVGQFDDPNGTWIGYVAWDPTGKRVAVASGNGETDSRVHILDGSTGELLRTFNPNSIFVQFLAWHPTTDGLLAVGQNTDLPMEFWDANAGKLVETQKYTAWIWNAAHWSPNGKWLAYAGWRPEVVDWQSREIKLRFEDSESAPTAVQFSRDGKWLAIADEGATIRYYETGTWKLVGSMTGHAGPVLGLQWGPRNERLASIGSDRTLRLWDPVSEKVVLSHDLGSRPKSLRWSEDGNTIVVSVDKRLHVFDMSPNAAESQ